MNPTGTTTKTVLQTQTYCIVDRKPIPEERAKNKSNTCTKECNKLLSQMRRARTDARKCRVCAKPSSPEERKAYQAWLRSHPEYKPVKLGRPTKSAEAKSKGATA